MRRVIWMIMMAGVAGAAVPSVRNVAMTQDAATRTVTISYELVNGPAIVTFDVRTNGVSIGTAHLDYAVGDVHRTVQTGPNRKIYWQADKAWLDHVLADAAAEAVITAWSPDVPPPYLVLNLVNANDVRHYATPWELPGGGVTNVLYKTDYLVLRRIAAKNVEWTMGTPTNAPALFLMNGDTVVFDGRPRETAHRVTLTNDFYIGVYEVTQKQWFRVKGTYPTYATAEKKAYLEADRDVHPADCVSWTDIRGLTNVANWPADDEVGPDQFMGKLRAYSGLRFDLPTEAQWEFACRAGTMSTFYSGIEYSGTPEVCDMLDPLAVYKHNAPKLNTDDTTAAVGTKVPNAWGLYDTLGNLYEWCLDRTSGNDNAALTMAADAVVDPLGAATGDYRIKRGGCMAGLGIYVRASYRGANRATESLNSVGFRVAVRIP